MLRLLMDWYEHTPPRWQTWLRHWIVMPGKRLLSRGVIVQDGFVIARRLDQSIPFKLVREKQYEPHLTTLLSGLLRPGDTFIDVGANIGYFTLLAAARVGSQGQVHSFEPNPRTFAALQHNAALNRFRHITLNNLALSDKAGKIELWVGPEIDSGLASMRRTHTLLTEAIACQAITLDDYVVEKGIGKIRAMKLDIEGAELLALQGARHLLSGPNRPDVIALELVRPHAAAFGVAPATLVRFLQEERYHVRRLLERPNGSFELSDLDQQAEPPDGTLIAHTPPDPDA